MSHDMLIQKTWWEGFFRPYLAIGCNASFLIHKEVEEVSDAPRSSQIMGISPEEYHLFGISGVYNLGAYLEKVVFVETGMTMDIFPALRQPNARVRNTMLSVALGMNIHAFIAKIN